MFQFFTVSIQDDGSAAEELNAFLRSRRVLAVERRWIDQGLNSLWAFCLDYVEQAGTASKVGSGASRAKVDYKEVLSPEHFAVFVKLRELRKQIAQAEGVPVYTIFTNEQLAKIVQTRCGTKADLEKIAGVGDARIAKYGDRVLEFLKERGDRSHETGSEPVPQDPGPG